MYRQHSHTFPLKKPSLIRTTESQNLGLWEQIYTNLTSLLRPLRGPGVDNLRYAPFPVGGYTNINTRTYTHTYILAPCEIRGPGFYTDVFGPCVKRNIFK